MKKVLITGGNKGIGLEITKFFIKKSKEHDFDITVVARDFSDFKYENVNKIQFDLSETSKLSELFAKVSEVDILINNAGMMNSLPYDKYTDTARDYIMNLNLYTPVELINHYSKGMVAKKSGRIVNLGSIAGQIGHPDIWYGISKAGILNLTKSYAKILGPSGVVINAVAPGPVATEMLSVIPEERVEQLSKNAILGRVAKPEEIAKIVYSLSVESPEYLNGETISLNNGMYMR